MGRPIRWSWTTFTGVNPMAKKKTTRKTAKNRRPNATEAFKQKVVMAVKDGMTHKEAANKFKVGINSIPQWLKKYGSGKSGSLKKSSLASLVKQSKDLESLVKQLKELDNHFAATQLERNRIKRAIKDALDSGD